jgi:hypothetical protein
MALGFFVLLLYLDPFPYYLSSHQEHNCRGWIHQVKLIACVIQHIHNEDHGDQIAIWPIHHMLLLAATGSETGSLADGASYLMPAA